MNLFISLAFENPTFYFSWVFIVMFSICIHEYAHAVIALRCGDDTAAEQGHLTLNPLVQMGSTSIIVLCLIGIAWGAVPVTPGRTRHRSQEALIAFAGPFSNLMLCIFFAGCRAIAVKVGGSFENLEMTLLFFEIASASNGVLFLFNMMPIPLLDGWVVLSTFVEQLRQIDQEQLHHFSWIAILLVLVTPLCGMLWSGGYVMGDLFYLVCRQALSLVG